jgi:hypothetical protein
MAQIPVSTVPAVKAYLLDLMQVALAGPDLQVYYSEPGPGYPDDVVYLGDTEQQQKPTQMVGSGGAGWLFESYHQVVEVDVYRGGDDPQAVFERAAALVAQIESLVRSDPSLGARVITAFPSETHYESGLEESHMGRITHATMRISVEAQI